MVQQKVVESRLTPNIFFNLFIFCVCVCVGEGGGVLERHVPLKHVKIVRLEAKTIGKLSTRIQEVLIGTEGLAGGASGGNNTWGEWDLEGGAEKNTDGLISQGMWIKSQRVTGRI